MNRAGQHRATVPRAVPRMRGDEPPGHFIAGNKDVLMLAAFWYENREAAIPNAFSLMPFGFNDLLLSCRMWVV